MLSVENFRQMEKLNSAKNPDQNVKSFLAGKAPTPFESSVTDNTKNYIDEPDIVPSKPEENFPQKQQTEKECSDALSTEELKKLENQYNDEVQDTSAGGDYTKLDLDSCEKIPSEALKEKREEFNRIKEELIKDWEKKNGVEWPRYEEDVYSEYGRKIRSKGDRYDAHHVQPLELGGKNTADNLTPMNAHDHYDKQGIHRPGSPYAAIVAEKKKTA